MKNNYLILFYNEVRYKGFRSIIYWDTDLEKVTIRINKKEFHNFDER